MNSEVQILKQKRKQLLDNVAEVFRVEARIMKQTGVDTWEQATWALDDELKEIDVLNAKILELEPIPA